LPARDVGPNIEGCVLARYRAEFVAEHEFEDLHRYHLKQGQVSNEIERKIST
jgi:hypothetical protein